jgi:predicted ATPase
MSLAESVAAALERRSRLLIFDNCEHVLNATADMIEAILAYSGTVKIVATSREGLRLNDEQLWPVPSLDINSSAAKLFVERASAVAPAASLDSDTDAVTEICRRLDGIPLAIELAASRLLSMTVIEIRDLLDDSGSWSARGAGWNAIKRCTMQFSGHAICSPTTRRHCSIDARYSREASISQGHRR